MKATKSALATVYTKILELDSLKNAVDQLYAIGAVQEAKELNNIILEQSGPTIQIMGARERLALRLLQQAEGKANNSQTKSRIAFLRHQLEKEMSRE